MKIDPIFTIISLCITALIGYGFFMLNSGETTQLLICILTSVMLFVSMTGILAIRSKGEGSVGNIRAISIIFFIIELIVNLIFSFANFQKPTAYIIVNGLILVLFITICYSIYRALNKD